MSLPPVVCQYVTEDCIREWKSGNTAFRLSLHGPVLRFLYELCWAVVRGVMPLQKCKVALESVDYSDILSDEEKGSNFADIVAQMAQDITMPAENRSRLIKLARWLVDSAHIPLRLLHERCEEEFLSESELIKIKAQDLKAKEVRVNTRLLYQQTKFNLLREESEGYAKLVTLLCCGSEVPSRNTSSATIGVIKSLIGHFDLDPNRVFDIVLECFELQPDNSIFLDLIPIFPKSHASQILGFKFQYYQHIEVTKFVPFGLYRLTALLVREGFIDLDCIYAHLLPKDDEAFEHYRAFSSKRMDEANKIGRINLAATGKDLMDDEKQGDVTIDLYAAVDMETEATAEHYPEVESGQTLGLLSGFLYVGDWHHANVLLDRLAPLNPVAHVQICDGLFRLIEKSIVPTYGVVCQTRLREGSPSTSSAGFVDAMVTDSDEHASFIDLPKQLFEMLTAVGPYFHRNTILLQKVCRVLRAYYLSALRLLQSVNAVSCSETTSGTNGSARSHLKEARGRIEEALGACILPSLQLIPANPAVGQEIWEVMNLLPYEVRYRLYGEWEKDDEHIPLVLTARQTAKLDTRRILKRLAKENLKQLGRMIAKLAHANPMTVLRTIVLQIEAYRDMIAPVVDAFKYLTQLEYDILEYVVIERLAQGGRQKLKDDGLNLSDWLQSLASFWGHLCKKYPSMELRGLFQYLVNQLKRGNGVELVVLQELMQQMANVQYTENMTEEQLDAMAGGETLRYQAASFGMYRNNKALSKSTIRLRDALLPNEEPKLAIPLLLLVAQHRSVIIINANAPYIKMVSEQFDRCHGTLLQYVEFLNNAISPETAYAQLVPPLDALVHQYHLEPEVAFLIYRPVMRLFGGHDSTKLFWPLNEEKSSTTDAGENESDVCSSPESLVLDIGSSQKSITWADLLETVKNMLPPKAWNSLSPDLYITFWGLNLYDLYVPSNRYESETSKLHVTLKSLEETSDNSSSAISKRKKEKERIQELLDRLNNELMKHEEHVASVHRRLTREKDTWLSSCPDTLKINVEFLQRCIFPRCTFSMPDAVYCAMFVQTLHSLQTPFFNTVNHIDVLICKTLQPMICCCTEYEAGRLGRFLYETWKMAYYWKSDESVYERECGNMPGFAVYYRFPNSQRVTYSQFIKIQWKWSQRITRLLIQCLESAEYMEIRNALIMLTKISGIFPVTRKSGINLEKRVAKIKSDEREDLKVLATGVAAALAARKPSWVGEEEFGMGYLELKPPLQGSKPSASVAAVSNGFLAIQTEPGGGKLVSTGGSNLDITNTLKDPRGKPMDMKFERAEFIVSNKSDMGNLKSKEHQKHIDESASRSVEDGGQASLKAPGESESRTASRQTHAGSLPKSVKQEPAKDDGKSCRILDRASGASNMENEQEMTLHASPVVKGSGAFLPVPSKGLSRDINGGEVKPEGNAPRTSDFRGSADDSRRTLSSVVHSPQHEINILSKTGEKQQKRLSPIDETERLIKRRKGESEESDIRVSDKEKALEARLPNKLHSGEIERPASNDQGIVRSLDRLKDKGSERHDVDYRERADRLHGDDEKFRDRRERSVERVSDKSKEDKSKDDKGRLRHYEMEKSHADDRLHGHSLPPPPPLPPNVVPQHVRREEDADRRVSVARHTQRLSPRHEDRRRSEENLLVSADDAKRRREEDVRERKRDDHEASSAKAEREREREREREKGNMGKEEIDATAASKRRKLKREYAQVMEPGEYAPPTLPPLGPASSHSYDVRDRLDRKGSTLQHRVSFPEDPVSRLHPKDISSSKFNRHDIDLNYDREWEEEKRQRVESKRRHRK